MGPTSMTPNTATMIVLGMLLIILLAIAWFIVALARYNRRMKELRQEQANLMIEFTAASYSAEEEAKDRS